MSGRLEGGSDRFRAEVPVRFKDIDIGGHAHHSHALVYFEEARAAYWRAVAGRPGLDDIDYVLADARIRFHARVLYPETLTVSTWVSRLGKKHFVMEYEAEASDGTKVLSGQTTQVMFDYANGRTKPVPDDVRRRIEERDGPGSARSES